jgi:hypothetical protein
MEGMEIAADKKPLEPAVDDEQGRAGGRATKRQASMPMRLDV